jgi:hypothetical protein
LNIENIQYRYSGARQTKTIKIGNKEKVFLRSWGEILTGFEIVTKEKNNLKVVFGSRTQQVVKKKSGSSAEEICMSSWFANKYKLFILQGDEGRK